MPTRYFMEFPSDVFIYAITVGLTIFYDRQLRTANSKKRWRRRSCRTCGCN